MFTNTQFLLLLAAAIVVTALITSFITRLLLQRRWVDGQLLEEARNQLSDREVQLQRLQADQQHLSSQLEEYKRRYEEKSRDFIAVNNDAVRRKAELESRTREQEQLQAERHAWQEKAEQLNSQLTQSQQQVAQYKSRWEAQQQAMQEQQQIMQQYGEQLKKEFQLLADGVLSSKAQQFNQQQETKLNDLLQPVRQKLEEFKADITQKFSLASNERTELKEQVRLMAELNQQLSRQAESLTRALSSQVKQQGNWGESILETILQHVGLQKDVHYFTQQTATNDDGQTIRPDFVVRYPDDRYVVIDSKVSLVHYQRMLEASDPAEQQTQLNLLVRSVKQHIDGLAGRQYHHIRGSLDYVLLFIPVEGAFITAMQADQQLWKYAHDRKILLLSPTLLLSAMKLIHELWKQDDINRNAALMAERAGKLYDKLAGFLDNFENIGKKLQDATQSFTAAKGQLYTGRGNALSQAQELKTLGARTSKQIADENPPELPLPEEADTEEE